MLIGALAFVIVLAGCGSGKNEGNASSTPPASTTDATDGSTPDASTPAAPTPNADPVSIVAYAWPADKTEENATLDARIKRFEAKYPNVTVTPKYWKYENTEIAIKMASNSAQTEFTTWATEAQMLSSKKWIIDLTDKLNGWTYAKDLNSVALAPFIIDGKTYGIPIDAYGMTITINKKLFKDKGVELPPLDWTWDDMLTAAKAVNDPAKGIAGFVPMGKGTESGWNWTNFLYSAGGEVESVADGKVTATFNSEAGLKALQFYKDLKDANVIPKTWALGYGDALTLFKQGRAAMVMCGSGNALDTAINQGGLNKDDLLIYPIPSMTKGGKHIGIAGGNYKVINGLATKEQQQAAFDFVVDEYFTDAYLDSIDAQITSQKGKNQVYVPQLINYWNDDSEYGKKYEAVLAKHDNVYKFPAELSQLMESKKEASYETQAYYGELANVIQKVFTSKGDIDLQKILDDAAAKIQKNNFDKVKIE
ncbi:sugar ABC transporter substrate-binding protein [Cohnella endophytica]|uniref:Sugar ABC transporter substrate-binding protein n=2 Tax=Cohnella endophytica TaxID=2419778 RepID=A0A494XE80_9BACL|nr:sugar ABC transporter substrate-binding protein [Cohnella endophytica]